jgi:putative sigma-54 modulation protein
MRLRLKGKNIDVTGPISDYAQAKLGKLARQLPGDPDVEVALAEERNPSIHEPYVAEATVFLKGTTLRAKESAVELQVAIDRLHANLERQIRRYREKRREEPRRHGEHHQAS